MAGDFLPGFTADTWGAAGRRGWNSHHHPGGGSIPASQRAASARWGRRQSYPPRGELAPGVTPPPSALEFFFCWLGTPLGRLKTSNLTYCR